MRKDDKEWCGLAMVDYNINRYKALKERERREKSWIARLLKKLYDEENMKKY